MGNGHFWRFPKVLLCLNIQKSKKFVGKKLRNWYFCKKNCSQAILQLLRNDWEWPPSIQAAIAPKPFELQGWDWSHWSRNSIFFLYGPFANFSKLILNALVTVKVKTRKNPLELNIFFETSAALNCFDTFFTYLFSHPLLILPKECCIHEANS